MKSAWLSGLLEPAAFQRRHRRAWQTRQLESHGRSCRQSKPIKGPPDSSASKAFGCARANGRDDGKPVGPELANPAGSIGLQKPAKIIGRQSAYLIQVGNEVAPKTE